MQVKSLNIKVDTVGTGAEPPANQQEENQTQQIENYFDDSFGDGASGVDSGPPPSQNNPDPIDDYTFGDIQGGSVTQDENAAGVDWLEGFPPTVEEIIAGNENAINYLDLVIERYGKAKEDILRLKDTYENALATGQVTADEAAKLNHRLGLIETALAKCDQEIGKAKGQAGKLDGTYIQELSTMKDLNNDGWVGRPFHGYYIKYNDDGTITYFDPKTKRAVPNPMKYADTEARLTEDGSLEKIDKSVALNADSDDKKADLYLKLTEEALDASNTFQTPININISRFLWVEKRGDGNGQEPFKTDEKNSYEKAVLYDEWDDSGGVHQKTPADKSRYMQLEVTGVKVYSTDSGVTDADGNKLYNTVVELYNGDVSGGTLLARMRIEGFYDESGAHPGLAAPTADGQAYIAASSVGMGIDGKGWIGQIDAYDYKSTGRHIVDNLADALGIGTGPEGTTDEEAQTRGQGAFDKNMGAFRDVDDNFAYDADCHDVYVPASFELEQNDANKGLLSARTGIFVQGVRGDITGTSYNDVVHTIGTDEYYDFMKDVLPDNIDKLKQDDPFYNNRVTGMGGSNVFVVGKGDNYLHDATFVWANGDTGDDHFITMSEIPPTGDGTKLASSPPNPSTFVHIEGGRANVYNPDETNPNPAMEGDLEAEKASYRNDYYEAITGSALYTNPDDADIEGGGTPGEQSQALDAERMRAAEDEPMGAWFDQLTKVPGDDETPEELNWDEVIGAKTELDGEMNGFFDEMFGGLSEIFSETG